MTARVLIPVLAAVILAAGGAMAQTKSNTDMKSKPQAHTTERCQVLEQQFDAALKLKSATPAVATAKTLRADGGKLCASGDLPSGINKLESALHEIGVAPQQ